MSSLLVGWRAAPRTLPFTSAASFLAVHSVCRFKPVCAALSSPSKCGLLAARRVFSAMASWSSHWSAYRLGDWLSIVLLAISYVILYFVPPHHRYVPSNVDPSLSYPLVSETVPAWMLFLFAVGVPLILFAAFFWIKRAASHTRSEYHNLLLAFCLCIILDLLTTDSIKKMTGRPRPNFFALTEWRFYEATGGATGYWGPGPDATASQVREAYQSFVSGHTSLSFSGLLFLSQFLFHQLSPLSPLHIAHAIAVDRKQLSQLSRINNLPSLFIPFLPIALATWISLTRIRDYWHFAEDVVGGTIVGSFFALATFNYCYLERRWTWLNTHPAPGTEIGWAVAPGDSEADYTANGGYQTPLSNANNKSGGGGSSGNSIV